MNIREISYAELAREARDRGDTKAFWRVFKQHARVQRKKWAKEKAPTVLQTVKGSN